MTVVRADTRTLAAMLGRTAARIDSCCGRPDLDLFLDADGTSVAALTVCAGCVIREEYEVAHPGSTHELL